MTSHAALIMSAALLHRSPPLLPPSFAVKLQRRFQVQRLALVLHLHGLPLSLLLRLLLHALRHHTSRMKPHRPLCNHKLEPLAFALLVARPHRKLVQHNGGRARNVEGGCPGPVLRNVHKAVAHRHLILAHALALITQKEGCGAGERVASYALGAIADLDPNDLAIFLFFEPLPAGLECGEVLEVNMLRRPVRAEGVELPRPHQQHGSDAKGGGAPRQRADVVFLAYIVLNEVAFWRPA
mmetsp:Transcript_39387/g.98984  ORF Transcript_39387/g.98984 Transcript_39387/m.98984 type:complete len:239 (-) Transcript_39387:209-925(-)